MSNMGDNQETKTPATQLKVKKTRHNRRVVISETPTEVITEIHQKKYKGEVIGTTVRKDHKYDPKQRLYAGRAL